LYSANQPIDSFTVCEKLKSNGKLEEVGGVMVIVGMCSMIGSSANIESHCLILKEKYIARKLIQVQSKAISDLYTDETDVFEVMSNLLTELDKINGEVNKLTTVSFSEKVAQRLHDLKQAAENGYKSGLSSGYDSLDRQTLGFQKSDLIILAARPAMGKTALAVDMARRQASEGHSVGIMSLEMSTEQLIDRIFAAETEIELQTIRKGGLKKDEWTRLDTTTVRLMGYPIYVCDRGGLNINDIISLGKQWKLKYDIEILYVDYLQLISGSGNVRGANREQEMSEVSRRLKGLAKELNIPVVALSQLSRKCEERGDKRPLLSDLRESGAIEQDADMVIFPFCPSYYDDNADAELCEVDIAKYRNGKVGMIELRFMKAIQKFTDNDNWHG
jgi:replicative DNA helicase